MVARWLQKAIKKQKNRRNKRKTITTYVRTHPGIHRLLGRVERIEYAKMNIHTAEGIRFAKNWIKSYDRNIRLSI